MAGFKEQHQLSIICIIICIFAVMSDSAPAESLALVNFKRTLSAADQQLLMKMKSKTRYIEALLNSDHAVDKRDVSQPEVETHSSSKEQCCNCNEDSTGCYHPDDVKRSFVIKCCVPAAVSEVNKRNHVNTQNVQSVADKLGLSQADLKLMQKHKSKLASLLLAAEQPAAVDGKRSDLVRKDQINPEVPENPAVQPAAPQQTDLHVPTDLIQKLRANLADIEEKLDELSQVQQASKDKALQEISEKFVSDVNLAKAKGIDLDDLLAALKKRAAA